MEKLVEWLAGETEVLEENLPQCRFVHHKTHMLPGREPGPRSGKPATNRLSYGTAIWYGLVYSNCSHLEHRASVKRFVSLQFLNLRHSVGLLGRVISPSQGRYLTQTQNKHRHLCLEWDSKPRPQPSSERRQFMP
jgi:hypothetical protein